MPDIAANATTTASVSATGLYQGVLETVGDRDWIRVDLTAGQTVQIDLRGRGFDPVDDTYLRLYDGTGALVAFDDDGGDLFNSRLTFSPSRSGTYFIEAASFGDYETGGYTVAVSASAGPATPPIGTNFTAAPRAPAGPLGAIIGDTMLRDRVIDVYFARSGDNFDGITSEGFNAYERAQFQRAFERIEAVANVEFRIVTNSAGADFRLVLDTDEMDAGTLGYFYSPGGYSLSGLGVFNGNAFDRQPGGNLEPGGDGFATIGHELMHGLGLMHPHDTGAGSTVMAGVIAAFDSFGRAALNQGIFTGMSYNSGYAAERPSWTRTFGSETGPMALDIAALQHLYGAAQNRPGNTTYVLDDGNGAGTGWHAIWDTGGIDTIVHDGTAGATINLRMAGLTYDVGGGGHVSAVDGVLGGHTIAARTVIENARGGSGADRIVGNGTRNTLDGRGGHDDLLGLDNADLLRGGNGRDRLFGGTGADVLQGQQGDDRLQGDLGADRLIGGAGHDSFVFTRFADSGIATQQRDVIVDFQRGTDRIDLSAIDGHRGQRGDQAFDFIGGRGFDGVDRQGDVRIQTTATGVMVAVDIDADGGGDMHIEVLGVGRLSAQDFIL